MVLRELSGRNIALQSMFHGLIDHTDVTQAKERLNGIEIISADWSCIGSIYTLSV
jgi:hypothetical protein